MTDQTVYKEEARIEQPLAEGVSNRGGIPSHHGTTKALPRIGPGLGRRSKIWEMVQKKVRLRAGKFRLAESEVSKLDPLVRGASWMDLLPEQCIRQYGELFDDEIARADVSLKVKGNIARDVTRTFTLYIEKARYLRLQFPSDMTSYFSALQSVLEAATIESRGVGYCQGMNFLAATFLLSEANERSAFILLSYILKECYMEILFSSKCSSLMEYMEHFEERLAKHNRKVYIHLTERDFLPLCYAVEWFTTCFLVSNPGELSACVIDLILAGYNDIMIRVGLALMDHLEYHILQCDAEKLQLNFKKMLLLANYVDVMIRAILIPTQEINGQGVLETMARNVAQMDPDGEWINTISGTRTQSVIEKDSSKFADVVRRVNNLDISSHGTALSIEAECMIGDVLTSISDDTDDHHHHNQQQQYEHEHQQYSNNSGTAEREAKLYSSGNVFCTPASDSPHQLDSTYSTDSYLNSSLHKYEIEVHHHRKDNKDGVYSHTRRNQSAEQQSPT